MGKNANIFMCICWDNDKRLTILIIQHYWNYYMYAVSRKIKSQSQLDQIGSKSKRTKIKIASASMEYRPRPMMADRCICATNHNYILFKKKLN